MNHALDAAPTLVLLPGLDGTGRLFEPLLAELPEGVRTVVIEYPADELLSIAEHVQFVVERLPAGRVVLLAESFSGLVALELLARCARPIDGVVFCAAFGEPPRPWLLRLSRLVPRVGAFLRAAPTFLLKRYCVGRRADAQLLTLLRTTFAGLSSRVLTHRLRLVATARPIVVPPVEIPCLYLQATGDRLVPPGAANWFARRFTQLRLERVAGPHFLLQTQPRACVERVVAMLDSVGPVMDSAVD